MVRLNTALDFLPRPSISNIPTASHKPLLPWLIRRVECIRGTLPLLMQCAPAFNYARDEHSTTIVDDASVPLAQQKKVLFESEGLNLDLRYVVENTTENCHPPTIELSTLDLTSKGHKGLAAYASLQLSEGQAVTFILRTPPQEDGKTGVERKLIAPVGSTSRALDDPFLTKVRNIRYARRAPLTVIFRNSSIPCFLYVFLLTLIVFSDAPNVG
jgi:hypothetical protein